MNYTLDLMTEILNINSPGGDTSEAINRLKGEFESLGVKVSKTNKGAIYGTIKGQEDENAKLISAHIDTLGAIVKEIKSNGNLYIKTKKGKIYTGTILPEKASIHIYSDVVSTVQRNEETVEVRIDEDVHSDLDVKNLGISVGDFVSFEPRVVITKNGYIKARYLDDKACVAIRDNNLAPRQTTHFFISNYEEIGHGLYDIPEKTSEILALDIGTVGEGHTSDEKSVTILAKDSRTPYDFGFRNRLVELAEKNNIKYNVDVHYRYGSDASLTMLQGVDANFACIGLGVDATHHYERTHIDGIDNNIKLLIAYIMCDVNNL